MSRRGRGILAILVIESVDACGGLEIAHGMKICSPGGKTCQVNASLALLQHGFSFGRAGIECLQEKESLSSRSLEITQRLECQSRAIMGLDNSALHIGEHYPCRCGSISGGLTVGQSSSCNRK